MEKVYNVVLQAQLAGIAAAKAGATGHDVDAAARKVIEDAGYGPYFGHSFGHSVGVEIHESPNATPANNKPLPLGAAVSAEPGIYLPLRRPHRGRGGAAGGRLPGYHPGQEGPADSVK